MEQIRLWRYTHLILLCVYEYQVPRLCLVSCLHALIYASMMNQLNFSQQHANDKANFGLGGLVRLSKDDNNVMILLLLSWVGSLFGFVFLTGAIGE